jgi:hypothetical protein
MQARMSGDREALQAAKVTLGESGPVWWSDDAPDLSGAAPGDTPYADWWGSLSELEKAAGEADSKLKK